MPCAAGIKHSVCRRARLCSLNKYNEKFVLLELFLAAITTTAKLSFISVLSLVPHLKGNE